MIAALLATPETLSSNGAFIGPGLALSVQSAASDGDIWKIVGTIMPIYGGAIFIGLVGMVLKPWARQDWTLRVSLRAAFYLTATLVSWMILTGAVIDLLRVSTGNQDIGQYIYPILFILTCGFIIWMYCWFFRNGGAISWVRSGALSGAMFGLILGSFSVADFLIRV